MVPCGAERCATLYTPTKGDAGTRSGPLPGAEANAFVRSRCRFLCTAGLDRTTEPVSHSIHATPAGPPAARERLTAIEAFCRCAIRVMQHARRWLARWRVPEADRDDVLQDALLRLYDHRASYDPERGGDVDWAYGFFGQVVRNHRKVRARRVRRIDVPVMDLPEVAAAGPSPEEEADEAMMRRLLDRCLASLDRDSAAMVLAQAEGIDMQAIATAHGVSIRTAYLRCQRARAALQRMLDDGQCQKHALGVAVLPISLDHLLASADEGPGISEATARRCWEALDRVMGPDLAAGRLGKDGTEVQRYMGIPDAAARVGRLARAARALLDPRVSHVLTALVGAAGGGFVMYQIMKGPAQSPHEAAEAPRRGPAAASVALLSGPAPMDAPASAGRSPIQEAPEPPAGTGAPELRPTAGETASAALPEDITGEQALFDKGATEYQARNYSKAIKLLRRHAAEHPHGRYAPARDRLLILALIRDGHTAEARQRIEGLRRANPKSPALAELEEALTPHR